MEQRIWYARVSTDAQNLDLQLDAQHRAGTADGCLYSDTVNGKEAERKDLAACQTVLREGDTLVVWRFDKLVFHVFDTLAEFELNLIRERTRAGLVAGRVAAGQSWQLSRSKRSSD